MQDKKRQILDAAIHCFARKGFHATSIQEIVDELGMAKGSIYFYFKSKDDLLISVFEYYVERLFVGMEELPEEWMLPPREKLSLQIERQIRFFREHLDFMRMLMKEPLANIHPHIQAIMFKLRARSKVININHLIAIYGKPVDRYLGDATLLLGGFMTQYFENILIDEASFDDQKLSRFLVRRLDDLIMGMEQEGGAPIMPKPDLAQLRIDAGMLPVDQGQEFVFLDQLVEELTDKASGWDEKTSHDLIAAISILQEEAAKSNKRNELMSRGMVALLRQQLPEKWQLPLDKLEQLLQK